MPLSFCGLQFFSLYFYQFVCMNLSLSRCLEKFVSNFVYQHVAFNLFLLTELDQLVSTNLYQHVSIKICQSTCINLSLLTCLYHFVSFNFSPSTYLCSLISINMSLSTCLYRHLSIKLFLSNCLYQFVSISYLYQPVSIILSLSKTINQNFFLCLQICLYQLVTINMFLWICPYKDDRLNVVSGRLGHLGHLGPRGRYACFVWQGRLLLTTCIVSGRGWTPFWVPVYYLSGLGQMQHAARIVGNKETVGTVPFLRNLKNIKGQQPSTCLLLKEIFFPSRELTFCWCWGAPVSQFFWCAKMILGLVLSLEKDLGYVVCGTGPLSKDSGGRLGGYWQRDAEHGTLCSAWSLPWSPLTTAWLGVSALWLLVVSGGWYCRFWYCCIKCFGACGNISCIAWKTLHVLTLGGLWCPFRWPLRLRHCVAERAYGVFHWLRLVACGNLLSTASKWLLNSACRVRNNTFI